MYRLEIVTGAHGITESIIWQMFPHLTPCTQAYPVFFTVYGCQSPEPLSQYQRDLLNGWQEEGDIVAWHCGEVEQ